MIRKKKLRIENRFKYLLLRIFFADSTLVESGTQRVRTADTQEQPKSSQNKHANKMRKIYRFLFFSFLASFLFVSSSSSFLIYRRTQEKRGKQTVKFSRPMSSLKKFIVEMRKKRARKVCNSNQFEHLINLYVLYYKKNQQKVL